MSKADIAALLERVRQASGPDREIDCDVADLFKQNHDYGAEWPHGKRPTAHRYTGSVDAIVALIGVAIPACVWEARSLSVRPGYSAIIRFIGDVPGMYFGSTSDSYDPVTPALALLRALLAAKLSLSDHSPNLR